MGKRQLPVYLPENPSGDYGFFTCPALTHIKQLKSEVNELKKLLTNVKQPAPPLDNSDLIRQYHISRGTAYEWRMQGLEYTKIGKKLFYTRESINAFLLKHRHRGF